MKVTSSNTLARIFDPRRPWALDILQLSLGSQPVHARNEFSAPERIGGEMIGVEVGAPVTLDVDLTEVEDGVVVSGELRAPIAGQCGRCLETFADSTQVSFSEFFRFSPDEEDGEAPVVVGGKIDLEQTVIDAVVPQFPLSPVCDSDCRGLCAECGVLLASVPDDHGHSLQDPRWAGLRAKFANPPNTEEPGDQS